MFGRAYAQCEPGSASSYLDYADVRALVANDGSLFDGRHDSNFRVPKNGTADALFLSSLWIGGRNEEGVLRTAGSMHAKPEFFPGPIGEAGPPTDCTPFDHVWVVSVDDVARYDETGVATDDLENWPTGLGAPTLDVNGLPIDVMDELLASRQNRKIDLASGERPAIFGHQMAWWIMNDAAGAHLATGSEPLGLEVHGVASVVALDGPLSKSVVLRYRIFNRSGGALQDMYVGQFVWRGLGFFADDYIGSDSTLSLVYSYNQDDNDEGGYGMAPPALGLTVIKGPAVPSVGDTATVNDEVLFDHRNLRMTSALYFPDEGSPRDATEYFNYMRGLWRDGSQPTFGGDGADSYSATPTSFMFSGNPPDFWSEFDPGNGGPRGHTDSRLVAGVGAFDMPADGEQEFIEAFVWSRGSSNLESIARLKEDVVAVTDAVLAGEFDAPNFVAGLPAFNVASTVEVVLQQPADTAITVSMANLGDVDLAWEIARIDNNGLNNFLTVANASGELSPPDYAAYALNRTGFPHPRVNAAPTPGYQQSTTNATWVIHAYGADSSYSSFLDRAVPRDRPMLADYEIRFTSEGGKAYKGFEGGGVIDVPFELWDVGDGSVLSPSEDVRLIPYVCESACGGAGTADNVFDIGGDHPVSPGSDDPGSDVIYFYLPRDQRPGDVGYQEFFAGDVEAVGEEVLGRIRLVQLDGGENPPYVTDLPEPGTVFRIERTGGIAGVGQQSGIINASGSSQFVVDIWADGLNAGTYVDTLRIETSDPENPTVMIPLVVSIEGLFAKQVITRADYPFPFAGEDDEPFMHAEFTELGNVRRMSASLFYAMPTGLGEAVPRIFQTETVGGEFSATLSFHYSDQDLIDGNVSSSEGDLQVLQFVDGRWQLVGGSADPDANRVTVGGLQSMGTFAIADPNVAIVGTDRAESGRVIVSELTSIYPNPTNNAFSVAFDVGNSGSETTPAVIELFDLVGRRQAVLLDQVLQSGSYTISYAGPRLAAGMYFIRLTVGATSATRSVAITR